MRFDLYQGKNGEWYWRLRARIHADRDPAVSVFVDVKACPLNVRRYVRVATYLRKLNQAQWILSIAQRTLFFTRWTCEVRGSKDAEYLLAAVAHI